MKLFIFFLLGLIVGSFWGYKSGWDSCYAVWGKAYFGMKAIMKQQDREKYGDKK